MPPIQAHILVDGDTDPGYQLLAAIPNHGDRLHIEHEGDVLVLEVVRIDHYPVAAKAGAANIFGSLTPAVAVFCRVV